MGFLTFSLSNFSHSQCFASQIVPFAYIHISIIPKFILPPFALLQISDGVPPGTALTAVQTSKPLFGFMQSCSRWLRVLLPELPNSMQYYTWRHMHVVRTCHPHLHIVRTCTLSTPACHPHLHVVHTCMLSAHAHVIRTSSAALLMVSMDLNYLSTLTGSGYWMEFVARMLSCFISGSYKWFVR